MHPSLAFAPLRRACVLMMLLVLSGGAAEAIRGAAPPPPEAMELAEQNRQEREVRRLRREGKLAEAVAAAEKMLASGRKRFGNNHAAVADALALLRPCTKSGRTLPPRCPHGARPWPYACGFTGRRTGRRSTPGSRWPTANT